MTLIVLWCGYNCVAISVISISTPEHNPWNGIVVSNPSAPVVINGRAALTPAIGTPIGTAQAFDIENMGSQ